MKEVWKDIKGYEGFYKASTFGKIKSLKFYSNANKQYYDKERILKAPVDNHGYRCVTLCKNGKHKRIRVHKIIAMTFIENPENKPYINHLNGTKTDNRVCNLEYCTAKENTIHAYKTGLHKPAKGKENPLSKKILQYDLEGNLIRVWGSIREIERTLGINNSNICQCCKGNKNYNTCGGFVWRYENG